jgi:hypothetical protein
MATPVNDSLTFNVYAVGECVEVSGVDLSLLTTGAIYTDTPVQFEADVAPDDATRPYTYTISYVAGSRPVTGTSNDDPFAFNHTYTSTGTYTVEFWAWNCDMTEPVSDTVEISVVSPIHSVYLPVVLKNN